MADDNRSLLRRSLLGSYARLRERLTRRLGSADLASEALSETWMRLERTSETSPVVNPEAYLYRTALNVASNLRRGESRHLNQVEIDQILNLADDSPDQERIAAARRDMAILAAALDELPERQRVVMLESFTKGTTHAALASRFGVSTRTITTDVERAVAHIGMRLGRRNLFRSSDIIVSDTKEESTS